MDNETILQKTYDFLKTMIVQIANFPRDQRFLIGERIQVLICDLIELYIEAYYLPPSEKKAKLNIANISLEKIRYYVRLGNDLGFYGSGKYKQISEQIQELGRMTGGWIKSLEKK